MATKVVDEEDSLRDPDIGQATFHDHAVPVPLPVVRSPPLHPRDGDPWGCTLLIGTIFVFEFC